MKTVKYLALAAVALMASACSNNDDKDFTYNTLPGVTVEMGEVSMDVKENVGLFTVPITVTGERNGYVTVTIECVETGENPAIENKRYYLTTDRINIAEDSNTAEVEFRTIDNRGGDPDMTYNVKIVDVQGGDLGANSFTTVTIIDKGTSPTYAELPGNYIYSGTKLNFDTGEYTDDVVYEVTMKLGEPDGHGGGTVLVSGVAGMLTMTFNYVYDEEEKYGYLEFLYDTDAINASGTGYGRFAWTNGSGSTEVNPVPGSWNANFTAITFGNSSTDFTVYVFDQNMAGLGIFDSFGQFSLMRVPE